MNCSGRPRRNASRKQQQQQQQQGPDLAPTTDPPKAAEIKKAEAVLRAAQDAGYSPRAIEGMQEDLLRLRQAKSEARPLAQKLAAALKAFEQGAAGVGKPSRRSRQHA